jgi:hypothetical protein
MIWSNVQQNGPSSYAWGPYDAVISGLRARGLKPLVVIDTTPAWARAAGCEVQTCAPANPTAYASFARAAVERYRGEVAAWEIWNEPNNGLFWGPYPDAAAYSTLLEEAYSAIKSVDPTAMVVSGGLAPEATAITANGEATDIAPLAFAQTMFADGAGSSFDAFGWHPYDFPQIPGTAATGDAWYEMNRGPINLRSLMDANGDSSKRIWATEFGAPTDPAGAGYVTPRQQAQILSRGIEEWRRYSWAGPMIVYDYQDLSNDPIASTRNDFFGLVNYDGTPKPALSVFEAYAHGTRVPVP